MFKVFNKYPWLFPLGCGIISNGLVTKYFQIYGCPETILGQMFMAAFAAVTFSIGMAMIFGLINGIIQVYSNKNK